MEDFYNFIICHYSEIALKKGNRSFFERKLVENIKHALSKDSFKSVKIIFGRIIIELSDSANGEKENFSIALKKVFGISNFSFAISAAADIKSIKKAALKILQAEKFKTFKISAKRGDKNFPLNSQQINEIVGEEIIKKIKNSKVDLDNPNIICYVEVIKDNAFLYLEKIQGAGGLPSGISGKVCVLISGGIDSPVAAYHLMRRGAQTIFVHFHSYPQTGQASLEKVKSLVKVLGQYQGQHQGEGNLHLVPFLEIQKNIFQKAPERLRVIFYRRAMLKIAETIAKKEGALALVTGDNLGQVASQTLENITAVSEAVKIPIFRPLIGMDKEEIIRLAREIGTYEISIQPHDDCCSLFVPRHPETRASLLEIEKIERKLNI